MGEKFSLAAWQANNYQIIDLTDELAVKVKNADVLKMLDSDGNVPNPLLSIIEQNMKMGVVTPDEMAKTMKDRDAKFLMELREQLDKIMVKVVIEPPLIEAGHRDGISLADIKYDWKMQIFVELLGGDEKIEEVKTFLQKQGSPVVAAQEG